MALNIKSFNDIFKGSVYRDLHKLFDAIIVAADGAEFKAHKLVLSMRSEYFKTFFKGNIEKKDRLVVAFRKDILEDILIFIYTGEVHLHVHNIASVITAADYFQIDDLVTYCLPFALRELCVENCVSLLIASHIVERLGIANHCYRFVQVNFGSLVHNINSGIEELPCRILKMLLNDDSLGVADEGTVWNAIQKWVNSDYDERFEYVPELLTYIRWNSENSTIFSSICENSLVLKHLFCESTNIESCTTAFKMLQSGISNPCPDRCPRKLYLFIRRSTSNHLKKVSEIYLTYDEQIDIWRKVGEIDEDFHVLFAKNTFIYLFNTVSREMKAFDLLKKAWIKKKSMRSSRQDYFVVESENSIFVVEGYRIMNIMVNTTIERYDTEIDSWWFCAPIPPVHICGAAAISTFLYLIGYDELIRGIEMKALCYNILNDQWSNIEKPKLCRTRFAMISYHEELYILGGRTDENSITRTVEKYNPVKNQWEKLPPLPFPYELPQAIKLQNKLLVYDDCSVGFINTLRFSPCVWNDEAKTWDVQMSSSPFYDIHMYAVCCIDDRELLPKLCKENKDSATVWRKTPFDDAYFDDET